MRKLLGLFVRYHDSEYSALLANSVLQLFTARYARITRKTKGYVGSVHVPERLAGPRWQYTVHPDWKDEGGSNSRTRHYGSDRTKSREHAGPALIVWRSRIMRDISRSSRISLLLTTFAVLTPSSVFAQQQDAARE